MLYNRNAVLEYKTDTQFSPTHLRQLKCATTQTSPRENEHLSHIDGNYVQNLVNNVDETETEESNRKFYSVIADLKDNNVTLRRGKQKKHLKGITFKENEPEAEPYVSGDSLYDELLAVKLSEEGKTAHDVVKAGEKSPSCDVKEWQLNSIKKTGKSPSVSEMALIDELKKWQASSIEKPAKMLDVAYKHFDYKPDTVLPTAVCEQTESLGANSFIKELKKWQAGGLKNLKKLNCSSNCEAPSNWMEELKERQAEGLRDNKKQLSLEASKTQLVTSEVMVRVNPIASDDDEKLKLKNHASSLLQETTVDMEPVLTTEGEGMVDMSNEAVDNSVEVISLPVEEVVAKPYSVNVSFEKQYSFTTNVDKEIMPDQNMTARQSISSESLLPNDSHKLTSSALTAIVDVLCIEDEPVFCSEAGKHLIRACHDKVSEKEPAVQESCDIFEEIAMPTDLCAEACERMVNEKLIGDVDKVSECARGLVKILDNSVSISSSEYLITKQINECNTSTSSHELIADSSIKKDQVLNVTPSSNHDIEGSIHKVSSILPIEESFRRHLIDLSHHRATSTENYFVDLDDWMTMDWMDQDEPLSQNVSVLCENNLSSDSEEDMPHKLNYRPIQDLSTYTENTTKSVRSSPDYFTCSDEIQTLARYPGGKPKATKILHFSDVTVTSLPNISKENNCSNSFPFGILESSIGDDHLLTKTKSRQQISIQPVKEIDTTASSMSDTDSFVSVSEDYIITDEEAGVALLERRYLVPETKLSGSDRCTSGNSSSAGSGSYDTDTLRTELKRRGLDPGPIIASTKRVYVKKLRRLARNPETLPEKKNVYSAELERTLHTENWYLNLSKYETLEREVALQFNNSDTTRHWRQGVIKSSFCYLLLDPRITCNLPCRTESTPQPKVWSSFLEAIFYVGKGKRSRPYSHLYQAVSAWKTGATSPNRKIQHILDIWRDGVGVVCLHIFQNTIPVEAFTREAAIIDALMLPNLKNARLSEYYGVAATWASHKKKLLGVYLLYKAMLIFLNEGERQLRPADIGH